MIEVKSVTKKYDDFTAIENISLIVDECSVLGVVGFNGCGKTTLLNVCAGIFEPDSGAVYLDGNNVFDNDIERKELFYISDNIFFPSGASIKTSARFYSSYYPNFDFEVFKALCELFSLDENKKIKALSKGMLRQVALAIAFSSKPKYLLIDETFDGLDPHKKDILKKVILEYISETSASIIISSHELSEISDLCDKIAIINGKNVVVNCSMDDISNNFRRITATFQSKVTAADFEHINHSNLKISPNSVTLVVRGNITDEIDKLHKLNGEIISADFLTLEEVFSTVTEVQSENEKIKKLFR